MEKISLLEYIWRNCYQIVAWENEHDNFPDVFGCGFMLKDDTDYIFVTADHVVHYKDYEEGNRTSQDYHYALVNNQNGKDLSTAMTTIYGFNSIESYDFNQYLSGKENIDVALIPDLKDFSFSRIGDSFPIPFYTHELNIDKTIIVPQGKEKLYLKSDSFTQPSKDRKYIILGVVKNKLDGIKWQRCNIIYCNLSYIEEKDGMYRFRNPTPIKSEDWKGLSGSPFFDENGKLIGMLVRAADIDNSVWVIPILTIMGFINRIKEIDKIEKTRSEQ